MRCGPGTGCGKAGLFLAAKVEKCKNFWRESLPAGFFPVRNLKNPKKIRVKVRTAKIFRTKIKIAGKIFGAIESQEWTKPDCTIEGSLKPPLCAIPAQERLPPDCHRR